MQTGVLKAKSPAYIRALTALADTSAAPYLAIKDASHSITVSMDFVRSINIKNGLSLNYVSDYFQRSVRWILTGKHGSSQESIHCMLIISPYEAQELLPSITTSQDVSLHLYAPRPNLGYKPLDSLDLYTVLDVAPSFKFSQSLIVELNLFAG